MFVYLYEKKILNKSIILLKVNLEKSFIKITRSLRVIANVITTNKDSVFEAKCNNEKKINKKMILTCHQNVLSTIT